MCDNVPITTVNTLDTLKIFWDTTEAAVKELKIPKLISLKNDSIERAFLRNCDIFVKSILTFSY